MGVVIAVPLAIAFPLMRRWGERNALNKMEQRDIAGYKGAIEKHPEIPYSYQRLAEIYRKNGHYEEAADYYRQYMERTKDKTVEFRVRRCLELAEQGRKRSKICTECSRENPQNARYCVNCGQVLPGAWEVIQALRGQSGARNLGMAAVVFLTLGSALALADSVPPIYAVLCFWLAVGAFIYYMYKRIAAA